MKIRTLANTGLETTRLAYGCWRLAGTWDQAKVTPADLERGKRAIHVAYDAGYTLFDHADIYCSGVAETIFGQVLSQTPGLREKIVIATKCGIRFPGEPNPDSPQRYDFSAEHIIRSCEGSLKRLCTDVIDLYQLHRPDYLMDPDEVAAAFSKLHQQGKVRYFGVSNFTASQLGMLHNANTSVNCTTVHQVQISLMNRYAMETGLLDQCVHHQITPLAWSPLAGGILGDHYQPTPADLAQYPTLVETHRVLDEIATAHATSRSIIALAWILKHPSHIIPIVGSTHPDRIKQFTQADDIELSREEWYKLLLAARGEPLP